MTQSCRPNVVFIMADQMKWSALRMYSEIGIETPSLERLAVTGVTFQHAITPHPLCVPARVSIMASRYAHSTGCRRNETLMPEDELHAFRIWKEAGYVAALIGKNHCFVEQSDLDLFDVRCEISHRGLPQGGYLGEIPGNKGVEWVVPEHIINQAHSTRHNMPWQSPTISYAVSDHPVEGYGTNVITTQAEAFLERYAAGSGFGVAGPAEGTPAQDSGFALWVSYPDPHEPYEAPRRYAEMFPPEHVKLPSQRDGEFSDGTAPERNRVLYRMLGQRRDTQEARRAIVSTYQAMVRFIDDGVGRILGKLDQLGLREDTIVVFTSDHGDFMGEHGMAVKGGIFYDCLVRVPLIISWPGGGLPQNVVDSSMVNTIDILPTLLQLQGIADFTAARPSPREGELPLSGPLVSKDVEGAWLNPESLRYLQGRPLPTVTDARPRHAAFSEYGAGGPPFTMPMLERLPEPYGYHTLIDTLWAREAEGRRKMVRTRRWKYVTDPSLASGLGAHADDELYDLENDPWELRNVAQDPKNAEVIVEMKALLLSWMAETEDPRPVPLPPTIGRSTDTS